MAASVGGALRAEIRPCEHPLALLLVGTTLVVFSVAPFAGLLAREGPAWLARGSPMAGGAVLGLLLRSVGLSAMVTLLALAAGLPLVALPRPGQLLRRPCERPGRQRRPLQGRGGRRTDLNPRGEGPSAYGKRARVASGEWGTLRVVVRGALFETYLDGKKLFEVEDATFADPGRVGVWTKAASVTHFDDLRVSVVK